MGGIGGGNFNFQPDGKYNRTYCRVTPDTGAEPLCIAFAKQGNTVWSSDLVHAGTMTTTFTGYWPTAVMQYQQAGMPVAISLECFSPICAGDNKNSSLPLVVYIFTLTNNTTIADTVAIALSNAAAGTIVQNGNAIMGIKSADCCVMVSRDGDSRLSCGTNRADFVADGILDGTAGGVVASRIVVAPSSARKITFTVAWTNVVNGYYRNYFSDPESLAVYGLNNAAFLKAKVDNWHNKILNSNLPVWLKDLTINCCHVYNSMTDWVTPNTYGMQESMSNGHYGTLDQLYHASMALPIFAPDAAWSDVLRMAGVQQASGLFLHFYSGENTEIRSDGGAKFILQVFRNYLWTGNSARLKTLYPNVREAIRGIRDSDTRYSDGLPDDSLINTYDNLFWAGWDIPSKVYDCELYLAALKAASKIAAVCGDDTSAANFNNYFVKASASFERTNSATTSSSGFWNQTTSGPGGRTGYYTGSTNITIDKGLGCWDSQLAGQWYADLCGLGPLHPENRIQGALQFINAACLDQTNPPSYALMCALPNVSIANTSTYFCGTENGSTYVTYGAYPAGDLCVAFGHGLPDISMRALQSYWNVTYSKYLRVYNQPCKLNIAGFGVGWGIGRYMNAPAVFASLFGITGFSIDVAAKSFRLKPSLPTGMDSLKSGPLMNPISLGTVDYWNNPANGPSTQRFLVRFDSVMQFTRLYVRKLYAPTVDIVKNGSAVPATIGVNSEDTSEYQIAFANPLTIDSSGVLITVGGTASMSNHLRQIKKTVEFYVDMERGWVVFRLPWREKVAVSLVNGRGESLMHVESDYAQGLHTVRYAGSKIAAGHYYVYLKVGENSFTKKVVVVR
jgi:uncharacterized protein (DUF608 family)